MFRDDAEADALTWVGRPLELVRALDSVYLDQARADWAAYVSTTLRYSQIAGGRYNPPDEFGALYTADGEETAWEEIAARFRRQGIPALPPDMGMLSIVVQAGRYADLTDAATQSAWQVDAPALSAAHPTRAQRDACWTVARAVRAVADFLQAPSARAGGATVPLFPDREGSELRTTLQAARRAPVPEHLRQQTRERW